VNGSAAIWGRTRGTLSPRKSVAATAASLPVLIDSLVPSLSLEAWNAAGCVK